MMKRALPVVLGLLGLSLPVLAQPGASLGRDAEVLTREELEETGEFEAGPALNLSRSNIFSGVDSATLIHGLPVLTLLDGRRFPISTQLGRMGTSPLDVRPLAFLRAVEVEKVGSSPRYGSDGPGGVVNLRTSRWQTGGEVGFFYGRSDGKYGREDYSGYIVGGIGNEKFNITVGASYTESTVKGQRSRR
jgi:outer membrane receptor protein involved in Fe transport